MFGIFYVAYNALMSGANKVDKGFVDAQNRERAMKSGNLTYYGRDGGLYLCENGRQVVRTYDRLTGDDVIKDFKNGKVYYNLTRFRIQEQRNRARLKGNTVYIPFEKYERELNIFHRKRVGIDELCGDNHSSEIDIETGHVVVYKRINGYCFYMDVMDGKLLRLTDDYAKGYYDKRVIRGKLTPDEIIRLFNERQDRLWQDDRFCWTGNPWTKEVFYLCSNQSMYMTKEGKLYKHYYTEERPDSKYLKDEPLQVAYCHRYMGIEIE